MDEGLLQQHSISGCELVAEVTHSFGQARLKVTGSSMVPTIWPEDVITVRRCNTRELQPGQIVLYRREGMLVAHRITRVCGDLLMTRGDTLQHDDPPVRASAIVGEVVSLIRHGHPVDIRPSWRQRISSSILRQSGFCLRMTLRLGLRLRRQGIEEIA